MIPIVYSDLSHAYTYIHWTHLYSSLGYHVYRRVVGTSSAWIKITLNPIYVNFYKVSNTQKYSRYEYKITYIDGTTAVETDLTDAAPDSDQSPQRKALGNVFKAIHKITEKSFALGKAEYSQVLIKPQVGPRCSGCYDTYTKDTTKHWCTLCHNTKIFGGYIYFDDIPVRFGNQGQRLEGTEFGYDLKEGINVQLMNYPPVQQEDIIIRSTGQRYFITGDVRKIQMQTLLIKQVANVREILVDEGEYYTL